jgi:tetratricopeptide (TPR) repeat protein
MTSHKAYLFSMAILTLLILFVIGINGSLVADDSHNSRSCGVTPTPEPFEERFKKIVDALLEKEEPLAELCVKLHNQPLPENNVPYMQKKVPLGDTVFMRYPGIFSGTLSETVARIFTAVTLSNDIEFKRQTLKQLTGADQTNLVRYRAWLELARLYLRNRNQKLASSALTQALGITLDNEAWKADAHFLQGSIQLTFDKNINAALSKLETALSSDPNFVDAYVLYIHALLQASLQKESYFSQQNCTDKLTKLMDSIDMIACQTKDRQTFLHLASSIESLPAEPKIKSFIVGYSHLLAGNYSTAEQRIRSLHQDQIQWNSSPCTQLLIKQASQVLDQISTLKP